MVLVKNQIAKVLITIPETMEVASLEVPAFTQDDETIKDRVNVTLDLYLGLVNITDTTASLGDFAMFLLHKASEDPREYDYEEDDRYGYRGTVDG